MSDTKVFVADDGDVYVPMSKWNEAVAEIARLRKELAAWKAEAEAGRSVMVPTESGFSLGPHETMRERIADLVVARAATDAIEKNAS